MEYKIKILELEDQPTLTMRETNPLEKLQEFFGKAFGGVMAYLNDIGEAPAGMPFGKFYNLDMTALDVEAGFPVAKVIPGKSEVHASTIPAGTFISTVHIGNYDSMEPAYDALKKWAKENGYETTGICYEYYLNDPTESPKTVAETEIRFPLKRSQK